MTWVMTSCTEAIEFGAHNLISRAMFEDNLAMMNAVDAKHGGALERALQRPDVLTNVSEALSPICASSTVQPTARDVVAHGLSIAQSVTSKTDFVTLTHRSDASRRDAGDLGM